jgi:hypothetical protein
MLAENFARVVVLSCGALAVSGCGSVNQFSPEMTDRALAYNQAVAVSTNQLLLINVVRASEREPRYFTRFGSNLAQAGFTGSLALTLPIAELNGGTSVGSAAMTPGASTGNTVTLDNLDDRKYQVGANAPIDGTTVEQYWHQGLQPDVLGLLFLDTISVPVAEFDTLNAQTAVLCDAKRPTVSRFCFALNVALNPQKPGKTLTLSDCVAAAPRTRKGNADYVMFINDPSWDSYGGETHPETCFVIALRTLLALGLHPVDNRSTTVVAKDIDDNVSKDAHFRTEMIKASLSVKVEKGNKSSVSKQDSSTTFALEPDVTEALTNAADCGIFDKSRDFPGLFASADDREALGYTQAPANTPDAGCAHHDAKVKAALSDLKIDLHIRSFESVIYYLGEIARSEAAGDSYVAVPVLGRAPWSKPSADSLYEEPLFDVEGGAPHAGAPVVTKDDHGATYWIPDFCDADATRASGIARAAEVPACSTEYPNHESLTVLTIVNQLWGLQKEPDGNAATPTVSIGK